MYCHSPLSIKGEEGSVKNRYTVPCGRCAACLSNRRSEWATRLEYELKDSKNADFITLTYSQENVPRNRYGAPVLNKEDLQKFLKRLRHHNKSVKLRYYLCGEYGEQTFRPHYHAIIFNLPKTGDKLLKQILEIWDKGMVHIGEVNPASIKYVTGYMVQQQKSTSENMTNKEQDELYVRPFSLMSKGLGKSYIEKHAKWHKDDISRNYVVKSDGQKSRLPRYYREKLYTKAERNMQKAEYTKNDIDNFCEEAEKETLKHEVDIKERFKKRVQNKLKNNSKL